MVQWRGETSEFEELSGDLGVQRGLVRWFLSRHSPSYNFSVAHEKVAVRSASGKKKPTKTLMKGSDDEADDSLPLFGATIEPPGVPDVLPVPMSVEEDVSHEVPSMPPPFTPSIKQTLTKMGEPSESAPVPLPEGLSVSVLKSRLEKKKIKFVAFMCFSDSLLNRERRVFLTPKEMEQLTEPWKPYRSLGESFCQSTSADNDQLSSHLSRRLLYVVACRGRCIIFNGATEQ